MAKLTLNDVKSGFNLSAINNNFDQIETALNENVLYRNNPEGEPNSVMTDIDMNGQRILNLPRPVLPSEPARLIDIEQGVSAVNWDFITGKPATFTPSIHQHNISEVNGLSTALDAKQATLVSGTNIKTVNGQSVVGSGDLVVSAPATTWGGITGTLSSQTDLNSALTSKQDSLVSGTTIKTINGTSVLGSGDITISGGGGEPVITAGTTSQYWRGDKTWQDLATAVRAAVLTGLSTATSTAAAATDSILVAIGKLQAQVSLRATIASPSFTGTSTFQGVRETTVTANTGTAYTVANTASSISILTLTGNCTFTFPAAASGGQFTLILAQDATGARTVTWPATVRWAGGTAPTITATASRTDVISFVSDGTYWLGFVGGQNFTRA